MRRHEVINKLIEENGYKSYLEIGLGNMVNFKLIKCEHKVGVDPTVKGEYPIVAYDSDTFFDLNDLEKEEKFDVVFIDGHHIAEQVQRDIVNSWNALNKGGVIILHDVYPVTKESQLVPKVSSPWKGDVWRAFVGFMAKNNKVKAYTTLDDTGLGFIWKSNHKIKDDFIDAETSYEEFDGLREEMLKIQR